MHHIKNAEFFNEEEPIGQYRDHMCVHCTLYKRARHIMFGALERAACNPTHISKPPSDPYEYEMGAGNGQVNLGSQQT